MNAVLYFSKSCLKDIWRRLQKENAREDSQDIRPAHGWQWHRRGGGCMDITPDCRLMDELRVENTQTFFSYLRMEPVMFDELAQRVGPRIQIV